MPVSVHVDFFRIAAIDGPIDHRHFPYADFVPSSDLGTKIESLLP